jgi:hypothetical protein
MVSAKKIQADKPFFHLLNIAGGVLMIINALAQTDYPNVFVNAAWAVIGLFALYYYKRPK